MLSSAAGREGKRGIPVGSSISHQAMMALLDNPASVTTFQSSQVS